MSDPDVRAQRTHSMTETTQYTKTKTKTQQTRRPGFDKTRQSKFDNKCLPIPDQEYLDISEQQQLRILDGTLKGLSKSKRNSENLCFYLKGYALCRRPLLASRDRHLGALVPPF